MSVGFRHHRHGSGFVVPADLKKAEELLLSEVKLDHEHDVPFCAGMSQDGKTLYVDKDVPEEADGMELLKPLVVHEMVEHCLMRMANLPYEEAHYIATAAEEACVRANHYDAERYNSVWDKIIRKVGSRANYPDVPEDLDTDPYAQEDHGKEEEKMDGGLFGKIRGGGKAVPGGNSGGVY